MKLFSWLLVLVLLTIAGSAGSSNVARAATCTSLTGPGIPPPASVPSGIPGYHAAWYGQSGYSYLCPGQTMTQTIAYFNSGTLGWYRGVMGQAAFLGTWGPTPGKDQPSVLGGDGTLGTPNTGWPRYNRVASQPADYVGPGQVAWFTFTIQAPTTPGKYLLYLRPLIEGSTWLEDYGVYWVVNVLTAQGEVAGGPMLVYYQTSYPAPPTPVVCRNWPAELTYMRFKMPARADLCLLPYDPPPTWCAQFGGCYIQNSQEMGWAAAIWVRPQPTDHAFEVFVTAHELCHSHQDWRNGVESYPQSGNWEATTEGQAFAVAWDQYWAGYPHVFGFGGSYKEAFGDVCASWFYPRGEVDASLYPPLAQFLKKWVPK